MPKSLSAYLLVLALLCIPLRADEKPIPKNIIAMLLLHQGPSDKTPLPVFVSTKEETDPALKKWIKKQHEELEYCIRIRVTAGEMDKISSHLHEGNGKPFYEGYLASCLNAEGQTDFLLGPKESQALFRAIADCKIPKDTREVMLYRSSQ